MDIVGNLLVVKDYSSLRASFFIRGGNIMSCYLEQTREGFCREFREPV